MMLTKEQIKDRLTNSAYVQTRALREVGETALELYKRIEALEKGDVECASFVDIHHGNTPAPGVEPKRTGTGAW